MRILLDTRLTVEQNAALHYERAKKAKRKVEGTQRAIERARAMMAQRALGDAARDKAAQEAREERVRLAREPPRRKEWFEALRWCITSDGFLCVGGRDASTNEIVIKKHAMPGDLVFHTDAAGAPFVVLKADGKEISAKAREEAAAFAAATSRTWKSNLSVADVSCVAPAQLSKTPNTGEFLGKGAFVIRGHVTRYSPALAYAIGKDAQGRIMGGPATAVAAHCPIHEAVLQGDDKPSDAAKRLAKILDATPDEILRALPPGGVRLKKAKT